MEWIKKYWLHLIVSAIIIGIVIYILKPKTSSKKDGKQNGNGYTPPPASAGLDLTKILQMGSSGAEVTELQKIINEGYIKAGVPESISVDGVFGTETAQALYFLTGKWTITLGDAMFILANV